MPVARTGILCLEHGEYWVHGHQSTVLDRCHGEFFAAVFNKSAHLRSSPAPRSWMLTQCGKDITTLCGTVQKARSSYVSSNVAPDQRLSETCWWGSTSDVLLADDIVVVGRPRLLCRSIK